MTMIRRPAFAAALALAVAAAPAFALDEWMSEADLSAAFAGVTLEGKYGDGRAFNERYGNDGRVEYREAGQTTGGHWSVQAGTFCTIYDGDATGGCFRVKKVSGNCYEFYFVARTEAEAWREHRKPDWTARGSVVGKPGVCADQSTV
ncbi:MAG: hypothetical protein ACK4MF_07640 [Hyphomicrobiaceae bacterium]